jgi:NodT family efflux transporter outer membrane factor (OMF) lipoprotein
VGNRFKICFLGILAVVLSGCAVTVAPRPRVDVPEHFIHAAEAPSLVSVDAFWYQTFASSELDELIKSADVANQDLAAAQARVVQADARARAAGAAILPEVSANGSLVSSSGHAGGVSGHETDWAALLSASYEIDFWGKNRATLRSAQLQAAASVADRETLKLTVHAAIANTYFQVLSLRQRVGVAEADLKVLRTVLDVIEARYQAGLTGAVELATQRAAIASAQVLIPQLHQQESEALDALALLVGHPPEGFDLSSRSLDAISEPQVDAGLPSTLLTRRPDLSAAEANLRAADADVAAARAAMLPTIALTVSGGLQNPALQAAVLTLAGTGPTLTVGATLIQTVFDGGRRRALRNLSLARKDELLATYRGAVLAALVDVENALAARGHLDEQRPLLAAAVTQSQQAVDGALSRFQMGSGDYLTLLEAQRTLHTAQDQLSQYVLQRLQVAVGLCRALGGGWGGSPPAAGTGN